MARRELNKRNIRKITKSGGYSYSVTLPIEAVKELKWRQGQKIEVEVDKKKQRLIIKDWSK